MPPLAPSSLARFPLFARFTPAELEGLIAASRTIRFPKGASIFTQGDDAPSFFVLIEGYVRAIKTTAEGEEVIVRYVSPGEMFGVAAALGLDRYPATAVAVVDAVVLSWASASWPALAARYPQLAAHALQTVGSRLQDAHARVIELTTEDVARRIARALLRLAAQAGRPADGGIEIEFPLRRVDIAQLAGTTLHSASRVLSGWEQKGFIVSDHQRVVVCNMQALSCIAEDDEADAAHSRPGR